MERKQASSQGDAHTLLPRRGWEALSQFFDNGAVAFAPAEGTGRREKTKRHRIETLEAKRRKKYNGLGELMEGDVTLKNPSAL